MRKTRKGVEERYMKFLDHVYNALKVNEKSVLNDIAEYHGVSKALPAKLRKLGIIRYTISGNEWIGNYPNLKMVDNLRTIMKNEALENKKKRQSKAQPTFEWAKPQPTVKIEPRYQITPQPDSSLVSEFIDHHEQSLLPPRTKRVKTAKNIEKTRMFQLRIFGLNLFTIKY